jgi:hypothetical protein
MTPLTSQRHVNTRRCMYYLNACSHTVRQAGVIPELQIILA